MMSGVEVTADKRTTDIVTGRQTMFRLSVVLDSGFFDAPAVRAPDGEQRHDRDAILCQANGQ